MLLLFLLVVPFAAQGADLPTETVPRVDPATVEIFALGANRFAFFWPAPEPIAEPFQVEAQWNGQQWTLAPETARPSLASWEEVLNELPRPGNKHFAPRGPDRRVVALHRTQQSQETIRLTFFLPYELATYEFVRPLAPPGSRARQKTSRWSKRKPESIDLQPLLMLRERDLVKTFTGSELQQGIDLWNAWLPYLQELSSAQLIVYRAVPAQTSEDAANTDTGTPWVRLIQEVVDTSEWHRRFLSAATPALARQSQVGQTTGGSNIPPEQNTAVTPIWVWVVIGVGIVAIGILCFYFRHDLRLRQHAVGGPVSSILEEILRTVHQHALTNFHKEPRPTLGMEEEALKFAREGYERAAQLLFGRNTTQLRHFNPEFHARLLRWLSVELGTSETDPVRIREALALGLSVLNANEESRSWWQIRRQSPAQFVDVVEQLRKELKQAEERVGELSNSVAESQLSAATHLNEKNKLAGQIKEVKGIETNLRTQILKLEKETAELKAAKGTLDKMQSSDAVKAERRAHFFEVLRFLEKAKLHYWNYGQHSSSSTVLLFIQYFAAWQIVQGIEQDDSLLEDVGWVNLRNLLQRLATVSYPSLNTNARKLLDNTPEFKEHRDLNSRLATSPEGDFLREILRHMQAGPSARETIDFEQLAGWPLYFSIEAHEVFHV